MQPAVCPVDWQSNWCVRICRLKRNVFLESVSGLIRTCFAWSTSESASDIKKCQFFVNFDAACWEHEGTQAKSEVLLSRKRDLPPAVRLSSGSYADFLPSRIVLADFLFGTFAGFSCNYIAHSAKIFYRDKLANFYTEMCWISSSITRKC